MFNGMKEKEIQKLQFDEIAQNSLFSGDYIIKVVSFDGILREKIVYNAHDKERAYLHYYRLRDANKQINHVSINIEFNLHIN